MNEIDAIRDECRSADVTLRDSRIALHAHNPPPNVTCNQELVEPAIFVDLLRDYNRALARVRQAQVRWDSLHHRVVFLLFRMLTFTCIHSSHIRDHAGHM